MTSGRCFGVGVGPGDPELMTVKAVRVIPDSAPRATRLAGPGAAGGSTGASHSGRSSDSGGSRMVPLQRGQDAAPSG